MKRRHNNLYSLFKALVAVFLLLIISVNYASSVIVKDGQISKVYTPLTEETIMDESIDFNADVYKDNDKITVTISTASEVSFEDSMAAYIKSIQDAKDAATAPEVINLPTLFKMNSFHPYPEDLFGKREDQSPIFKVKVKDGDMKRKNKMAITFDSAYINKYTYTILDILDEYDVKATFFMTYEFMAANPAHIMEIVARGHEIGNHSTTHPDFNKVTDAKVVAEVWQCHDFLKNLLGVDACLFRFPYGSYSPRTVKLVKNLGYYPIQWSFDSIDWKNSGLDFLIKRFEGTDELTEGAIILFHNGATYTPDALPYILDIIKSKGLKCIKVSDLIYPHNFYLDTGWQISNE